MHKLAQTLRAGPLSAEAELGRARPERIRFRILLPLIVAIAILFTAFGLGIHEEQRRANERSIRRAGQAVQRLLGDEQTRCLETMALTIQGLLDDDRLGEAFRERNRPAMLERTEPLFQNLKRAHKITHFYFHSPERVNLLRVHSPERHGDLIQDNTLLAAERTGQAVSGLEHGQLGAFVLRLISPWRRDGRLLGYVELGVDFQDVLQSVHQGLDVELFAAVDKRALRREAWETALRAYGRRGSWDEFPDAVVMDKTLEAIPEPARQRLRQGRAEPGRSDGVVYWKGGVTQFIALPLRDITGQSPAQLIVLRDITAAVAETRRTVLVIALMCLVVSAGLIILFSIYLGRIEDKLTHRTASLRAEIAERQTAQTALREAHDRLEERVEQRTQELQLANTELRSAIARSEQAQREVVAAQQQLVESSRQAGMAEVATSVLHNVGNVLNSVNVSASLVSDQIKQSRIVHLPRLAEMMRDHAADLGEFITKDPKGRQVPLYLGQLGEHLLGEQQTLLNELNGLRRNVEHIKGIVSMQQSYARLAGATEKVRPADLLEDALRMVGGSLKHREIRIVQDYGAEIPEITVDKHKVLQIVVNLLRNAQYACEESGRPDKEVTLRLTNGGGGVKLSVLDNGVGIQPENLTRIFEHGFTTRKTGHGFGLHSGALAAKEMGGQLRAHSAGAGAGATFTLELPLGHQA